MIRIEITLEQAAVIHQALLDHRSVCEWVAVRSLHATEHEKRHARRAVEIIDELTVITETKETT